MQNEDMILADDFCNQHHIDISFIMELNESGLIQLTSTGQRTYLSVNELGHLEKLVRMNQDLGINLEGVETIVYLMERMDDLKIKLKKIQERLELYENEPMSQ